MNNCEKIKANTTKKVSEFLSVKVFFRRVSNLTGQTVSNSKNRSIQKYSQSERQKRRKVCKSFSIRIKTNISVNLISKKSRPLNSNLCTENTPLSSRNVNI